MSWHPSPIGATVRAELRRFGPAGTLGEIVAAWPDAVGPAVAANAWPARRSHDGTLHVAASSSVWACELTQLEATIRDRLAERLGAEAPERLRFAVGRLPAPAAGDATSSERTAPEVSSAHRVEGKEIAAPIENEELRALVARAAAASLALVRARAAGRPLW